MRLRFDFLCLLRHSLSAVASFWARVGSFAIVFDRGARFPPPMKVCVEGAPKIGCGVVAVLQELVLLHGGGTLAADGAQGDAAEQTWAS
jgi:hypothetical protein